MIDATFVEVPRQRNSREENAKIKGRIRAQYDTPWAPYSGPSSAGSKKRKRIMIRFSLPVLFNRNIACLSGWRQGERRTMATTVGLPHPL